MAATTAAVLGLVSTGVGTIMSFTQAAKQTSLQREAELKAEQAMQEAKKKLEVNFYDTLSVQRDTFEQMQKESTAQMAQLIEATKETDKGAAATAGRLQAVANQQQAAIRGEIGEKLSDLEKLSATEDSRLRDALAQVEFEDSIGYQKMAADAKQAQAAAIAQGVQGISNMAKYTGALVPLFTQGAASKALDKQELAYNAAVSNKTLPQKYYNPDGTPMTYQQVMGVNYNPSINTMTDPQFREYMIGRGRRTINEYDPFTFGTTPTNR